MTQTLCAVVVVNAVVVGVWTITASALVVASAVAVGVWMMTVSVTLMLVMSARAAGANTNVTPGPRYVVMGCASLSAKKSMNQDANRNGMKIALHVLVYWNIVLTITR